MKNFAKRISALVLAVVVSAAVLCPAAFAAQLPSLPKDQCVVDDANALNSQVTQTIEELNAKLETNCKGAQIGVLTVQYTQVIFLRKIMLQKHLTLGESAMPRTIMVF